MWLTSLKSERHSISIFEKWGFFPFCKFNRESIKNTAARLVTRAKGRVSMNAILQQLHWLPIRKRILFKILLLTFKAMHGLAPQYITDMLSIRTPNRHLRSSTSAAPLLQRPLLKQSELLHMVIAPSHLPHQRPGIGYHHTFVQHRQYNVLSRD